MVVHLLFFFNLSSEVFNVGLQNNLFKQIFSAYNLESHGYFNKWYNKVKQEPNVDHLHIGGHRQRLGDTNEPK